MGAATVPLNDMKQAGQKVEFGLKVANGSFEGTLNKDEPSSQEGARTTARACPSR